MLQPIDGFPDGVIALRAVGKVTAADYSTVLEPAMAALAGAGRKVRLLLELGRDFDGYDFGAMLSDAKLGVKEFNDLEKMAIVTGNGGFRQLVEMLGASCPASSASSVSPRWTRPTRG